MANNKLKRSTQKHKLNCDDLSTLWNTLFRFLSGKELQKDLKEKDIELEEKKHCIKREKYRIKREKYRIKRKARCFAGIPAAGFLIFALHSIITNLIFPYPIRG